jgi:hypothetical protein
MVYSTCIWHYVKYGSARKCQRKCLDESVPSRHTIHSLVNKPRTTGVLIDKKQKRKCRLLIEEKLDGTGASLEHTPRKLLKRLAQETGVSKSSARTAKTIHAGNVIGILLTTSNWYYGTSLISLSACRKIPYFYGFSVVHYHVHKSLTPGHPFTTSPSIYI